MILDARELNKRKRRSGGDPKGQWLTLGMLRSLGIEDGKKVLDIFAIGRHGGKARMFAITLAC